MNRRLLTSRVAICLSAMLKRGEAEQTSQLRRTQGGRSGWCLFGRKLLADLQVLWHSLGSAASIDAKQQGDGNSVQRIVA
jgi:hypothetical protein